jgi:LCP family protein required for cell wall assembly
MTNPPTADGGPSAPPGATSDAAPRRRRRRWPRVLIVLGVVIVLVVGLLPDPAPGASGSTPATPARRATGTLNYVLLGSDSRDPNNEGNGRSDTIMVVHLNKARTKAYIVSFPRDMYVTIPGYGKNKINAAFSYGGSPLTVRTLESLTGVQMDHVVLVDFTGFIDLTNDLGGVTVTNKTAFSKAGYDFPKGKITIKGTQALWFVRERDSLPRGDLDRAENQRNVIKAIVAKGLSAGVISDPARFTSFMGNVAKHLTVDSSLSDNEIRDTALSLRLNSSDIEQLQAPISGFGTTSDGQSIDVVDTAQLQELGDALQNDTMAAYVKKYPAE